MTAGCVAQRLPGKRHSTIQEPDGQWAECFVVLHRDLFETLVRFGTMDTERPLLWPGLHASLVEQFEAILADLAAGSGQVSSRTLLRAHELVVSMYALDAAARAPDPHAELVQAACDLLSENVEERAVLPALSGFFGMSYERFRKVFRDRVGVAPGAYRIRRRIERACQLLSEERLSVKETAYALGYPDIYSFSRQFRQVMGTPPAAFRRGVR
jgi:AraC-like DNA-binding protein